MTVIAEITVPAEAFVLGDLLESDSDVRVELERVVPLQEAIIPLFWVSGGDVAVIEQQLHDQPRIETVDVLAVTDERVLYEVRWSDDVNGLVRALVESRAKILEASGTDGVWDFRLRFLSHGDLSAFNVALTESQIPVTLRRIYNPRQPAEKPMLSREQRETLLRAYRQGYFSVPRKTTLTSLASAEGVSDSALSQRIRRGLDTLIEQTLLAEDTQRR